MSFSPEGDENLVRIEVPRINKLISYKLYDLPRLLPVHSYVNVSYDSIEIYCFSARIATFMRHAFTNIFQASPELTAFFGDHAKLSTLVLVGKLAELAKDSKFRNLCDKIMDSYTIENL